MKKIPVLFMLCLISLTACGPALTPEAMQTVISSATTLPTELPVSHATASPMPPTSAPVSTQAPILAPTQTQAPPGNTVYLPHISAGSSLKINQVQMFSDATGWALGGASDWMDLPMRVLHTQDGARSWTDRTPPEPAPQPGSPEKTAVGYFWDAQVAWVTFGPVDPLDSQNQPVVWRTSDGGFTWQASEPLAGAATSTGYSPTRFFFSDQQHGWLMAHHGAAAGHTPVSIHRTMDGGQTWEIVARPMDETSFPLHTCCQREMIFFSNHRTGLVARDFGPIPFPHLLLTADGGYTWAQINLPEPEPGFFENFYCSTASLQRLSERGAAVVMNCAEVIPNGAHRAFLYATNDMGATWNWEPLPEPVWPAEWRNVSSNTEIQWLNLATGWMFVLAYYELPDSTNGLNATQIYQTRDGGVSWQAKGLTYWRGQFSFASLNEGFAIARQNLDSSLVVTQNGGLSWGIVEPVTDR